MCIRDRLGERTDLTKGYISQIERDLSSPSIETFFDILEVLGCTPREFFDEMCIRDRVMEGNCNAGSACVLRNREHPFLEAELSSVERLQMDRGEIWTASDFGFPESFHDMVAHARLTIRSRLIHTYTDHIHEPTHPSDLRGYVCLLYTSRCV